MPTDSTSYNIAACCWPTMLRPFAWACSQDKPRGGGGGGGGGGILTYSLGGGAPLGSRKSYPLLDQILQILWPYVRL